MSDKVDVEWVAFFTCPKCKKLSTDNDYNISDKKNTFDIKCNHTVFEDKNTKTCNHEYTIKF